MCFTEKISWILSIVGFATSISMYFFVPSMRVLAFVLFYFTLMELLQAFQYPLIDNCNNLNQILTFLGFVHICFQPLVTSILAAYDKDHKPHVQERFKFVIRLSAIAGLGYLIRGIVELAGITKSSRSVCEAIYETEQLRGTKLCTIRGNYHLGFYFIFIVF